MNPGLIVFSMIIIGIILGYYLTRSEYPSVGEIKNWEEQQEQQVKEYNIKEKKAEISAFNVWIKEQEAKADAYEYTQLVDMGNNKMLIAERAQLLKAAKVKWNKWQRAKEKHTEKYDSYNSGC